MNKYVSALLVLVTGLLVSGTIVGFYFINTYMKLDSTNQGAADVVCSFACIAACVFELLAMVIATDGFGESKPAEPEDEKTKAVDE